MDNINKLSWTSLLEPPESPDHNNRNHAFCEPKRSFLVDRSGFDNTANCENKSVVDAMSNSVIYRNTSTLSEDLRFITEIPEMCDVEFLVGSSKVSMLGVKAILSARSRVFYKAFSQSSKIMDRNSDRERKATWIFRKLRGLSARTTKSTRRKAPSRYVMEVPEIDPEVFRRLLTFIQTGAAEITVENVISLMNAAECYDVRDLRTACLRYTKSLLRLETVLPLLESCEPYAAGRWTKHVIKQILDFIAGRASEVFLLDQLRTISRRNAILIFSRRDLKVTDEQRWDAAFEWCKVNCPQRGSIAFRRCLKLLCRRVDFSQLPLCKLVSDVQPLGILPGDVIDNAIQHRRQPRFVIGSERSCATPTPMKPPRRHNPKRCMKKLASLSTGQLFSRHDFAVSFNSEFSNDTFME